MEAKDIDPWKLLQKKITWEQLKFININSIISSCYFKKKVIKRPAP